MSVCVTAGRTMARGVIWSGTAKFTAMNATVVDVSRFRHLTRRPCDGAILRARQLRLPIEFTSFEISESIGHGSLSGSRAVRRGDTGVPDSFRPPATSSAILLLAE
jgi:hypothetical protein